MSNVDVKAVRDQAGDNGTVRLINLPHTALKAL